MFAVKRKPPNSTFNNSHYEIEALLVINVVKISMFMFAVKGKILFLKC